MKHRVKPLLCFLLASLLLITALPGIAEEMIPKGPTVLLILDGYGVIDETEHNAIALADTPVMDRLMKECPFATGNPQLFGIARFRGLWYALECVSKCREMQFRVDLPAFP